jgi:hypothetical protein
MGYQKVGHITVPHNHQALFGECPTSVTLRSRTEAHRVFNVRRWSGYPPKLSVNADSRVRERDIADRTSEYLLWPEHCADVSAALNVVFKLINSEFLFGNYILEQIANGNNADHFCVFDYGQMTHALLGHQGHA